MKILLSYKIALFIFIFILGCASKKEVTQPIIEIPDVIGEIPKLKTSSDESERYYITLCKIFLKQGNYTDAIKILQRGLLIYPNSAIIYEYIGHTSILQGNFEAAISAYNYSVKLNSSFAKPIFPVLDALKEENYIEANFIVQSIINSESKLEEDSTNKEIKSYSNPFIPPTGIWNDLQKWEAKRNGWECIETQHYQIQSNGYLENAKKIANYIERVYNKYQEIFWWIFPKDSLRKRHSVKIFPKENTPDDRSYYNYKNKELIINISPQKQEELLLVEDLFYYNLRSIEVINHELWHQYIHSFIRYLPTWLNEGLAMYVSKVNLKDDVSIILGEIPKPTLMDVKELLETESYIPLKDFFYTKAKLFYKNPDIYYPQSWSIVYFLMLHENDPKYQKLYYPNYKVKLKYQKIIEKLLKAFLEKKKLAEAYKIGFKEIDFSQLEQDWKDFWLLHFSINSKAN